jgi:biotin transporter BioY
MKRLLRESYGVGILIFYFLKWPYVLGFPYMYFVKGLQDNWFLNFLWFYCLALIIKDLYILIKYGPRCSPSKGCETKTKD